MWVNNVEIISITLLNWWEKLLILMVFQQTQVVGCQDGGFRMTRRTFLPWYKKERNARVWVTLLRKNDDQVSLSSLLFSHGVLPYIRKDLAWIFSEQHSGFSVNHNLPLVYFCAVCSHQSKEEEEESFLAKWQYPNILGLGQSGKFCSSRNTGSVYHQLPPALTFLLQICC